MFRSLLLILCLALPLSAQCDQWETIGANPISHDIREMIWDGTRFVAVSNSHTARYATLMTSQTSAPPWDHTILADEYVYGIAFNGSRYMVCGANGFVATSTDLVNWETRTTPFTAPAYSLAAGEGDWVLLADNAIYRSVDDGLNWTRVAEPGALYNIQKLGSHVVAVGAGGLIAYSTDRINWSVSNVGFDLTTVTWNGLTYLVGGRGLRNVMTSTDLETWTARDIGFFGFVYGGTWTGTHFVLSTGTNVIVSQNGETWEQRQTGASGPDFFALVSNGSRTLVGGDDGVVYSSDDLQNWTLRQSRLTERDLNLSASQGGISIVGNNFDDEYFHSTDGVTWQAQTFSLGGDNLILDLAAGQGMFAAAHNTGRSVAVSSDGLAWTEEVLPENGNVQHVAISNQYILAVNVIRETFIRPVEGGAWVQQQTLPAAINDIVGGEGLFVAIGDLGAIYTSTDGSNWQTRTSPSGNHLKAVAYKDQAGGGYVIVGTESNVLYSEDGITWSRNHTGSVVLESVIWAGDGWLAVGQGQMLKSTDNLTWTPVTGFAAIVDFRTVGWDGEHVFAAGDFGALMVAQCNPACEEVTLTGQPEDQTVAVGQSATFSVTATGGEPIQYQWFKDDVLLVDADEPTLVLAEVAFQDTGVYQCRLTNACSLVFSQTAQLNVEGPPQILTQPVSVEACDGQTVNFQVEAAGSPPITYQWKRDGAVIAGADQSQLTLAAVTSGDAGVYTCVVTNTVGEVTSDAVQLSIASEVAITQQPQDQSGCLNSSLTLTIAAEAEGTMFYQWYKAGIALAGKTEAFLELTDLTEEDTGIYQCVVRTVCHTATSREVVVSLAGLPVVLSQPPANLNLCEAADLSLTVVPDGLGPFTYQWHKDGVDIPGSTGPKHVIIGAVAADSGDYSCTIDGACGSVTSEPSQVDVFGSLSLSGVPEDTHLCSGETLSLTAEVTGTDVQSYRWYKDDEPILGAEGSTYEIASVTPEDAGSYAVIVIGDCGFMDAATPTITVDDPVFIAAQPQSQTACLGDEVTFSITATGAESYQWYHDGLVIPGATGPQLVLPAVTAQDWGVYHCELSSICGVQSGASAELTSALDVAAMTFDAVGQGLEPVTLAFDYACELGSVSVSWIRESDEAVLAVDVDHLTLDPAPIETTRYRAEIQQLEGGEMVELFATVLVSQNPLIQDPDGDGCNTLADLHRVAPEWRGASDLYEADNNAGMDIRDLLYINTTGQTCLENSDVGGGRR